MKCKKASLVINPRSGENLAKIADILPIFAAAGWNTDLAIKEYGGHMLELAARAAKAGSDLIIAYGGDGTLSQVVNAVMSTKREQCLVGVIPGGTANVWAGEVHIPDDPVKAVLALVDSDVRKVDIGHIEVEGLEFLDTSHVQKRAAKTRPGTKRHFLLMAGLGIDAAVMGHVSKPLKHQIGPLAVGASAAEELPKQRPFPVEIRSGDEEMLWKGEALQVVVGNTRHYADITEVTPQAYIDDGLLDVCVITAGNPLTTTQQILSLLLRRRPDNQTAEYFRGSHLSIRVPASIALQLDGSAVKLKKYLNKQERKALAQVGNAEQELVTYRFDVRPQALKIAIPRSYDDTLFQEADSLDESQSSMPTVAEQEKESEEQVVSGQEALEHGETSPMSGRRITVVGTSLNPAKKGVYIVAGKATKQATGEAQPVAVRINKCVNVRRQTGEDVSLDEIGKLREGDVIIVEGKKSKRGVIKAKQIAII